MKKEIEQLWFKEEDGVVTIGLTPQWQEDAGDVCYVHIAKEGDIQQEDTLFHVEASKATIEVPSPVSGKIVAVNQAAIDNPSLLNSDKDQDNWIAKLVDVNV